ncbi:MAG: PAS domain S-box protein [Proteobacteria bacterium]|nr:PAS domain S-box protein [Pseudomonadota bacterium]
MMPADRRGTLRPCVHGTQSRQEEDVTIDKREVAKASASSPAGRPAGVDSRSASTTFDLARDERPSRVDEERLRLFVGQAGEGFFLHDDRGRFLGVNQPACLNTGYAREQLRQMRTPNITDATETNKGEGTARPHFDRRERGDARHALRRHRTALDRGADAGAAPT